MLEYLRFVAVLIFCVVGIFIALTLYIDFGVNGGRWKFFLACLVLGFVILAPLLVI